MFICNHCPYVKAIEEKISIETDRIKKLNVNSIAIMSNDQSSYIEDSDDGLREQIKRANFNFPYVVDSTQELGKMFEAQCTPEFYYFNRDNEVEEQISYFIGLSTNYRHYNQSHSQT